MCLLENRNITPAHVYASKRAFYYLVCHKMQFFRRAASEVEDEQGIISDVNFYTLLLSSLF